MGLLVALLGVASIVAWATTIVALIQAINGATWLTVAIWGVIAIALTAARRATQHSAMAREAQAAARVLQRAADSSPALSGAIEYFGSAGHMRSGRTPPPHPTPVDFGGLVLMLLSWLCVLGGVVLAVVGCFQVFSGTWWVVSLGVGLLLVAGPLHSLQKSRYASRVLAAYEREMIGPLPANPSGELRLSMWKFAQAASPGGGNADTRVAQMIHVYTGLVAAWSEDQ
ncbi:hypothetical protein AB0N64_02170 [Microbacterium sp. NPDC089318]